MFTVHVPPDAAQSPLPTAVGVMFAAGLTLYVPGPSVNLYFPVASVIAVLLTAFPLTEFVPVTVTGTPGRIRDVSAVSLTVPVSAEPSGILTKPKLGPPPLVGGLLSQVIESLRLAVPLPVTL